MIWKWSSHYKNTANDALIVFFVYFLICTIKRAYVMLYFSKIRRVTYQSHMSRCFLLAQSERIHKWRLYNPARKKKHSWDIRKKKCFPFFCIVDTDYRQITQTGMKHRSYRCLFCGNQARDPKRRKSIALVLRQSSVKSLWISSFSIKFIHFDW